MGGSVPHRSPEARMRLQRASAHRRRGHLPHRSRHQREGRHLLHARITSRRRAASTARATAGHLPPRMITMKPIYVSSGFRDISLDDVLNSTPWIQVTDARLECFMSATTDTYTYGEGRGVRTYTPVPYSSL